MMTSLREQIIQEVLRRLRAASLGNPVLRNPSLALTIKTTPAIVFAVESERITDRANVRVTRELTIRLVAVARGQDTSEAVEIADSLIVLAHEAMMSDQSLLTESGQSLSFRIEEQDTDWEYEDADDSVVAIPARYSITYRTTKADLTK